MNKIVQDKKEVQQTATENINKSITGEEPGPKKNISVMCENMNVRRK